MGSYIGWRGEQNIFFIRVWKSLSSRRVLKSLRESLKRTIFASGELGLLQHLTQGYGSFSSDNKKVSYSKNLML